MVEADATIESFDADAYKQALASYLASRLGYPVDAPAVIELSVSGGSLVLTALIRAALLASAASTPDSEEAVADAVASSLATLAALSPSDAGTELGVTVLTLYPPTITLQVKPPDDNDAGGGSAAAVVAAVLVLFLALMSALAAPKVRKWLDATRTGAASTKAASQSGTKAGGKGKGAAATMTTLQGTEMARMPTFGGLGRWFDARKEEFDRWMAGDEAEVAAAAKVRV